MNYSFASLSSQVNSIISFNGVDVMVSKPTFDITPKSIEVGVTNVVVLFEHITLVAIKNGCVIAHFYSGESMEMSYSLYLGKKPSTVLLQEYFFVKPVKLVNGNIGFRGTGKYPEFTKHHGEYELTPEA